MTSSRDRSAAGCESATRAIVALAPAQSDVNSFINSFAAAIASDDVEVVDFRWRWKEMIAARLVILHWPNQFYDQQMWLVAFKELAKIGLAKLFFGTHFVWVAHNVVAHGAGATPPLAARIFVQSMDGVIYLSEQARREVARAYQAGLPQRALVVRHGRYCSEGATPCPSPDGRRATELLCFGLIRAYKNLVELVRAVRGVDNAALVLHICGLVVDEAIAAQLRAEAEGDARIRLDLRSVGLTDNELNAKIDDSDGVILSYDRILNSGAAIHALSRNRPVIAPRQGSLHELRDDVGPEWLYLFDGPMAPDVIRQSLSWISRGGGRSDVGPNLSKYDWAQISQQLREFLRTFLTDKPGTRPRHVV